MDPTQRQITKIAREVSRFTVRTLKAEGIGASELDVLHAVRKTPGISQKEVCEKLGLDKGAVARIVKSLEKKGYLTRRPHPGDFRALALYATPQAESLKHSKAHIEAEAYEWLLAGLTEEEAQQFSALLDKLYGRMKQESIGGFPHLAERLKEQ
jgi:DNA-binding MarR family transcriptional regulator